ncbi:hypothetical protein QQ008_10500 [Fulvivirgaceae bacterium BMA10]|uniref:Methylamine utilisation protein MauE domain-containing protein n=1 Tax=Splendidivirga corallicola TaxID=3051826 RepID=A0ABT8KP40_9BACT|nr:hypothetical protein [Fulvivirgaceae bacterium BMA10]
MLLPLVFKGNGNVRLNYFRIILIGTYLWSGIHKINPSFIEIAYPSIMEGLFGMTDPDFVESTRILGYGIPVVEILISFGLFFPRSRHIAVYFAILSHLFILWYLGPLGINQNSIVYPWNIAMILMVWILFFNSEDKIVFLKQQPYKWKILNLKIILLVWIFPVFNFIGYWDNYLSFSLYSEKMTDMYVAIEENELQKFKDRFDNCFVELEGITGGKIIDINKWALKELNVPVYPETRIYKQIAEVFCGYNISQDKLIFIEATRPLGFGSLHSYSCRDLQFPTAKGK